MKFQIPKRIYVDRGRDKGKSKPVGFRLPKRLLIELDKAANEYGYPSSMFISLILDGYLSQISTSTKINYPADLEKKNLEAVSYRLDNTLLSALKAAAGPRGLSEGDLVSIAVLTFLRLN